MKVTIGEKTFEQTKIKGRAIRKFLEVKENLDTKEKDFGTKEFDTIVNFIVDTFGNKFTSDDLLDELDASEIFKVFYDVCDDIGKQMSSKVNEFEKN
ncbi:MAG: hypothetical protein Q8936_06700 [Bacillota bacterium]|nr:hypothetical protein [Bacillota bacterium]